MRSDIIKGNLPDPFICCDGSRADTVEKWEKRREEIIRDAVGLEFDGMPPKPEVFRVEILTNRGPGFDGGSTRTCRIHCGTKERPFWFCIMIYMPAIEKTGKQVPVIITGDSMYPKNCSEEVIRDAHRRGFAVVKFNRTEMAPDRRDDERECGLNAIWPELNFSAISAWAWGYHRVVDALETMEFADMEHIAVTGHSRGGKTVLLAGATDTRIRYVCPSCSGTHGCAPYRFVQKESEARYHDKTSEELEFMFQAIPYWMGHGLKEFIGREEQLPHDMHFIKALIAPRCLLETNGYDDIWANPRGSYLAFLAAKEVWKLYGAEENCQTKYREGGHAHRAEDFASLFDFMEADMYAKPLPENITRIPYDDMEPLHDWTYDKA